MTEGADAGERRERILDVALDLVAQYGYRGLSMRRVARASRMSAASVAHHFHDMPSLLLAVIDLRDERTTRELESLGPDATARQVFDTVIQGIVDDPVGARLFATLSVEAVDPAHPAHEYFRMRAIRTIDGMRPLFEGHVEHPDALATQVIAVMDGLQLQFVREPDTFDIRRHWHDISEALLVDVPRGEAAAPREASRPSAA